MAENTVVKEQLTEEMIDSGARLTAELDRLGLPVTVAMWFFYPEMNEWRLAAPLAAISLIDPNHQLAHLLKTAMQTGGPPGIARIRFSKNVITGHFIEDALIYRVA
jgi:hypothetical protein